MVDEFDWIASLRPLANNPEALNLADDAAVIPSRPGHDLVITKDAIVEGVHFLPGDPLDVVARKLLRVNLSDLAAKGAEPYGYFLACAWPAERGWDEREAFARGLALDQVAFGLKLFGGDTVSTAGPMVFSATMLGWVKAGAMVRRAGAVVGDLAQVSGPIGDGFLGLQAALGKFNPPGSALGEVLEKYRLPRPRLDLSVARATAAIDISDGLMADAGHVAAASGVAIDIHLDRMPLSPAGGEWVKTVGDRANGLGALATGGDDYELFVTAPVPLPSFTVIGEVRDGEGVSAFLDGEPVPLERLGWRHGNEA